jgi:hypothetical protein
VVDKLADSGYNIRTGYKEIPYINTTKNVHQSNQDITGLTIVADNLKKVSSNYGIKPVIAGGAIRDILLGYYPKDHDVFIDVSKFAEDPDALQDFIDVFLYDFCVSVSGGNTNFDFPYSIKPKNNDTTLTVWANEEYKDMEGTFEVREWWPTYVNAQCPIQFIFMKEPMIEEDAGQFISDKFDYSLVKCYMDIETQKIYASDEFMKDIDATRITVKDESTRLRVNRWANRTGHRIIPVKEETVEKNKAKPSSMSKSGLFIERCLQHPKKWVG